MARLQVAVFIDMILRCVMSKPWAANMPLKVPVGKYSEEKRLKLGYHWAKTVSLAHTGVENLAKVRGFEDSDEVADETLEQALDLTRLAKLKKTRSDPADPGPFKRGDEVTVVRKMTWNLPQVGK